MTRIERQRSRRHLPSWSKPGMQARTPICQPSRGGGRPPLGPAKDGRGGAPGVPASGGDGHAASTRLCPQRATRRPRQLAAWSYVASHGGGRRPSPRRRPPPLAAAMRPHRHGGSGSSGPADDGAAVAAAATAVAAAAPAAPPPSQRSRSRVCLARVEKGGDRRALDSWPRAGALVPTRGTRHGSPARLRTAPKRAETTGSDTRRPAASSRRDGGGGGSHRRGGGGHPGGPAAGPARTAPRDT